jgi:2-iminobutanoate/2-iminopropanoate deaminase
MPDDLGLLSPVRKTAYIHPKVLCEGGGEIQMTLERPPAVAVPGIRHVDAPGYPAPHSPYSHAVIANGFVFVSGQIPVRPGGGPTEIVGDTMQEQTRQALRNVQTILEAAGSALDRVVKVTVLLARPDLYQEMNEAYAEFFPGAKPARAMVRFGADIPGVLVAIEAIALA